MHTTFYLILLFIVCGCSSAPRVTIHDGAFSEGQECFRIETPTATYLYQKEAGGFSNILDRNGTDWIQFHQSEQAAFPRSAESDYRGLPNLVFGSDDGGAGHPGFSKMISEITGPNQIRSISKSGKWQWSWTFYEMYAELSVEQTDSAHAYWFLYEGPIGGQFSPSTHYWGTHSSGPLNKQPDLVKGEEHIGHWHTVYFGDSGYDQALFVQQMEPDTLRDVFTYLGNSSQGNDSEDGMVVFGFGRAPGATPQLRRPQKFRTGFYSGKIENRDDHQHILSYINSLKPLRE